jgi:hypothetical protein
VKQIPPLSPGTTQIEKVLRITVILVDMGYRDQLVSEKIKAHNFWIIIPG